MNRTRIKLCGLSRPEDISQVNRLKPDLVGFVFVKASKRYIDRTRALELASLLDKDIGSVGVFMDQSIDEIMNIIRPDSDRGPVNIIQLHGCEDNSFIQRIRDISGMPVIKAFGIKSPDDIKKANESLADMILLDSPGGGSGSVFDHSVLKDVTKPFFLAGGLNPHNVYDMVCDIRPFGVDASSGLETEGKKDAKKMEQFVREVRKADREA